MTNELPPGRWVQRAGVRHFVVDPPTTATPPVVAAVPPTASTPCRIETSARELQEERRLIANNPHWEPWEAATEALMATLAANLTASRRRICATDQCLLIGIEQCPACLARHPYRPMTRRQEAA